MAPIRKKVPRAKQSVLSPISPRRQKPKSTTPGSEATSVPAQAVPPILLNPTPKKQLNSLTVAVNSVECTLPKSEDKILCNKKTKKDKKAQLERKLSRLLSPKPALNLLLEWRPDLDFRCVKLPSGLHEASVVCEDNVLGVGEHTMLYQAKNKAAENAIKKLIQDSPVDPPKESSSKAITVENNGSTGSEIEIPKAKKQLPWLIMARLALHHMLTEWEKDGIVIGREKPSVKTQKLKKLKRKHVAPSTLPANAKAMKARTLLNRMKPGLRSVELSRSCDRKAPPSVTIAFRIDDQEFQGTGSNAKVARNIAAAAACKALYGLELH